LQRKPFGWEIAGEFRQRLEIGKVFICRVVKRPNVEDGFRVSLRAAGRQR
jgi:hypothetical protein